MRTRYSLVRAQALGALAVAFLFGCGGGTPRASSPGDVVASGSGSAAATGGGGSPAVASGGAQAAPAEGGALDAGTEAGAADSGTLDQGPPPIGYEPGPRIDTPLVDEPGTRDWQCSAARQPSALGISPWGTDGKFIATALGLHLVRAEGTFAASNGSFTAERLVISSAGMDGLLGPDVTLGAEPGLLYGWIHVGNRDGGAHVLYSAGSVTERSYFAQPLSDGKPAGQVTRLMLDGGVPGSFVSLEDGYLFLGRTGDPVVTALDTGHVWVQKLDVAGLAVAGPHTVAQGSASRRMFDLRAGPPVRTDTGFLVLYRYATSDKIDLSHYRRRFQALDQDGRAVGPARALEPEVGTHIFNDPVLTTHGGAVLAAWAEEERTPDPASPTGFSPDPPAWQVIRVARFDDSGARIGPVRTVSPAPGARIWPELPYWVDLGADEVGLGWYERATDYGLCPRCWAFGKNYFVVLSADLQSAKSNVVSYELQTADAGFMARSAARFGDDILVIGDLAHNLWSEAASATLRCTR